MHTSAHTNPTDFVLDNISLKFYGPFSAMNACPAMGERGMAKPGERRRAWQELDAPVNPENPKIVTHELTDPNTSYASMVGQQVVGAGGNIRGIIADSACDGTSVNHVIRAARQEKCL